MTATTSKSKERTKLERVKMRHENLMRAIRYLLDDKPTNWEGRLFSTFGKLEQTQEKLEDALYQCAAREAITDYINQHGSASDGYDF